MAALSTLTRQRPLSERRRRRHELGRDPVPGAGGRRLRERLVAAGPIAARFGVYLGSRVDLLAGTDCLRLLEISDSGPASDPQAVSDLFCRELGDEPDRLFAAFDPAPVESGLVFQWHRARLTDGVAVTVELLHPELEPAVADGLADLRRMVSRLIAAGELPAGTRESVAEFERHFDLERSADRLEELGRENDRSRWVTVPRLHRRLSSARIRVVSRVRGRSTAAPHDASGPESGAARARRLSRIWLGLVLGGGLFPVEPCGRNVGYLTGSRVAFLGGEVARLPRASRADVREYLAAVVAGDSERAARAFLELLPADPDDRRLRTRIRHTDPFRDPRWDVGGDLFARQLLAHRHQAERLGYRPRTALDPFYRGLFLLSQEARQLAGEAEAVRDGFRETRLQLLFDQLRADAAPSGWSGEVARQVDLLSGLPQKLDRILTLAAEDDHERRDGSGRPAEREPREARGPATTACLLAMAAVVLLTHHFAEAGSLGEWPERVGALLVLGLGALLLRVLLAGPERPG